MEERRVQDVPVTVERRRRGRPPLSTQEPTTEVGGLKVLCSRYDAACAVARRDRVTLPAVIRLALDEYLERQNMLTSRLPLL